MMGVEVLAEITEGQPEVKLLENPFCPPNLFTRYPEQSVTTGHAKIKMPDKHHMVTVA